MTPAGKGTANDVLNTEAHWMYEYREAWYKDNYFPNQPIEKEKEWSIAEGHANQVFPFIKRYLENKQPTANNVLNTPEVKPILNREDCPDWAKPMFDYLKILNHE